MLSGDFMRIISGKYKGKQVDGFNIEGTRPTMDRVKESLVAMIQNKIEDSTCLDLFSGSGSVGLELLSNGAKKCIFSDSNPKVIEILKKNFNKLGILDDAQFFNSDFRKVLEKMKNNQVKFDIIFLDPPYEMNFITPSLKLINDYNLLNDDGIVICEYENENIDFSNYEIYKERKYGSKNVLILKKISV